MNSLPLLEVKELSRVEILIYFALNQPVKLVEIAKCIFTPLNMHRTPIA